MKATNSLFSLILFLVLALFGIINYIRSPFNKFIYTNYWGDNVPTILNMPETLSYKVLNITPMTSNIVSTYNLYTLVVSGFTFVSFILLIYNILKLYGSKFSLKSSLLISIFFSAVILISPIRIKYQMEWITYANWAWFAIYLLVLIKSMFDYENIQYMLIAAISMSLLMYKTPYLAIILAFVVFPVYMFFYLFINRHKDRIKLIKYLILFVVLSILIAIPSISYQFKTKIDVNGNKTNTIESAIRSPRDRWAYSAKPWQYFIPDISHPQLGNSAVKIHYKIWQTKPYYLTEPFFPKENTLYLGFILSLLSLYTLYLAFWKKVFPKQLQITVLFLLSIAITAFLFSMPPYVAIKNIKILFPSHFIYPFLPQLRAYARFGMLVVIINGILASIGFYHLITKKAKNMWAIYIISGIMLMLMFYEYSSSDIRNRIYTSPTPPYVWLNQQNNTNDYLEVPHRADYTDMLYTLAGTNKSLNPYLKTPNNIKQIESTLWSENFAVPDSLWCDDFRALNGRYLMFHKKDINKRKVVDEFIETGVVTEELKVAMAESWGYPVWGTHAERPEKDVFREKREEEMEALLRADPKFKVVAEFSQEEIAASRPNKNFSADKFDEVVIFEIDEDYCNSLSQDQE